MANAKISQVSLPSGLYDIYDASAIHAVQDLGLTGYLKFKGAVASASALPATGNEVGDIYHAVAEDQEYIWVADDSPAVEGHWEEFGSKLMVEHVHSLPSLSGSIGSNGSAAAQKWTQSSGTISGTAAAQTWTQGTSSVTVAGSNAASTVTGTVAVPKATPTTRYLSASANAPTINTENDTVLGAGTTFTASGTAVGANGTAKAITALGTPTTAKAITGLATTTIKNPTVTAGSAASWGASVTNGVLSFSWTANVPTAVSTSNKTVVTGSNDTADAITGFGTHTTANALTGVKVTAQPTITVGTNDQVAALTSASATAPSITLTANTSSATGRVTYVSAVDTSTQNVSIANGSAAAQVWTQGDSRVTVKGTNAASTVSGSATVTGTNAASKVTGSVSVSTTDKVTGAPQ